MRSGVFTFLLTGGYPLPFRSSRIIDLAESLAQIIGAQYFAGKILRTLALEDRQARDFF